MLTTNTITHRNRMYQCIHPQCIQENLIIKGVGGIHSHLLKTHKVMTKPERWKLIKEVPNMSKNEGTQEQNIDLSNNSKTDKIQNDIVEPQKLTTTNKLQKSVGVITEKLNQLQNMIPNNFCQEFPNLCKLGTRVDKLESTLIDIKKSVDKKPITSVMTDNTALIKDFNKVLKESDNKTEQILTTSISEALNGLGNKLGTILDSIGQNNEQLIKTLETLPKKFFPSPPEENPIKKSITETTNPIESKKSNHTHTNKSSIKNTPIHTKAMDLLDCPECRTKVLNALKHKLETKSIPEKDIDSLLEPIMAIHKKITEEGETINASKNINENTTRSRLTNKRPNNGIFETERTNIEETYRENDRKRINDNRTRNTKFDNRSTTAPTKSTNEQSTDKQPTDRNDKCRTVSCLFRRLKKS